VAGNDFDGVLKIKLGPVPVQYEGTATFLERSAEEQRIALEAHGKDRRGHGMIAATVTMTFTEVESGTDVEVISTVELTGQGAAVGETVVQEASDRLVQRLVDCVSGKFADGLGDLPSAEELAMSTPAQQAVPPRQASAGATSDTVEPQKAVGPDRVPAAEVTAQPADIDTAATSPRDTDDATATRELSRASAPPQSAPLSTTTGPQRGALATVVLPRVRRFGPPVLGALVVGSLISGIVRRLRR
jgi:uncharacterized protein